MKKTTCEICGSPIDYDGKRIKYCSEKCRKEGKLMQRKNNNELKNDLRFARRAMSRIETGKLDEIRKECKRLGLTYAEYQKQRTLELIRKGEL